MSKRDHKPPTRIKLSPIGRHPKHRKREPYDPRTLRHAARLSSDTAGQYRALAALSGGHEELLNIMASSTLEMLAALLKKEARAIERKVKTNE